MGSLAVTYVAWDAWAISWVIAAFWSRRTTARPAALDQLTYWIPTMMGFSLLFFGSRPRVGRLFGAFGAARLWTLPRALDWVLAGCCVAGLAFTWWARLSLGSLWSGSVSRKADHAVIETGPYRLVRHPIYAGLILAAFALAIQIGSLANGLGAMLVTFGFWLKARLEERFLSRELGVDAYDAYRRRTPMLFPFGPRG